MQRAEHLYDEPDRLEKLSCSNAGGTITLTYEYSADTGLLTSLTTAAGNIRSLSDDLFLKTLAD